MTRTALLTALLLLGALVAPLAPPARAADPNGVETATSPVAFASATQAMSGLRDARYEGSVRLGIGNDFDGVRQVTARGDCVERLRNGKYRLTFLIKGRRGYFKASQAYWRRQNVPAPAARRLHQKWIRTKASPADRHGCTPAGIIPSPEQAEGFVPRPSAGDLGGGRMAREFNGYVPGAMLSLHIAVDGPAHVLRYYLNVDSTDVYVYDLTAVDTGVRIKRPRQARSVRGWLR